MVRSLCPSSLIGILAAMGPSFAQVPLKEFRDLHWMLPPDQAATRALAAGDIDGDGDVDLLAGNEGPNQLYLNDGNGVFAEASARLPAHAEGTWALALGDLDGDGDLDAVIGNSAPGGEQNRLYLNDGSGRFSDATSRLPGLLDRTCALALGDVDGDGDLDLLAGNRAFYNGMSIVGGQNRLLLNDGSARFTEVTPTHLPPSRDLTNALALGDVDGDGDLDAVVGNEDIMAGPALNKLLLNDGSGHFADATGNLPAVPGETLALGLGDLDGDGDLDLLIGNGDLRGHGRPNQLFANNGAGFFSDATATLPQGGADTISIALGDVDGDGDLDAFLGNGPTMYSGTNQLLINRGGGLLVDARSQLPGYLEWSYAAALADVDGDGDLDALVGNEDAQNRLYLNRADGRFAHPTTQLPPIFDSTRCFAVGDLDGDGDLDVLAGKVPIGFPWGRNRLLLNDGSGFFADGSSGLPGGGNTNAIALGDVDRDGDLDALAASNSYGSQALQLLLNSGAATFADARANLPTLTGSLLALALGDVDGDGDLDLLAGAEGQDHLLRNDGAGIFRDDPAALPTSSRPTSGVALGDVDGDGDLDALLVHRSSAGSPPELLLNDGSGTFSASPGALPAHADRSRAAALADLDRDGDLDAVIATSAQNRVYLGDGRGSFLDAPGALPQVSQDTPALALGDIDGDGDLDLVFASAGRNHLLLNDGRGQFADASPLLPTEALDTQAVDLADLDDDQDLDILCGNLFVQDHIHSNRIRQLAHRGEPRLGKPLELELCGPPGGLHQLLLSAASAFYPMPPLGTLRVDPLATAFLPPGPLDAGGHATLATTLPPHLFFLGTRIHWQAILAPPIRLTNLDSQRLTDL